MVFASPSGHFYRDVTNSRHLSGLSHLDNFIVTRKSCPFTGTLQKRMPTLTQTATPHTTGPLTIIRRKSTPSASRTASNFIHRDKTLFRHLSICIATLNWFFPCFVSGDKFVCLDNFLRLPHNPANAHIKNWLPATYC
jgi:hypothetical protein